MEEGGEVEGKLKCSNKSARKAGNEAVGELYKVEHADAVTVAVAVTAGKEDGSPSPPSPSPKWRQRKIVDVERGGMAGAPTVSSASAEAVPEKIAKATPPAPVPLAPAMGSSGGASVKTLPASVVWPPSAASAATAVNSPRQDSGRGGAKYLGSVKRGPPRRGLSLPAGSPSRIARASAPSPKRPAGLQVRSGGRGGELMDDVIAGWS